MCGSCVVLCVVCFCCVCVMCFGMNMLFCVWRVSVCTNDMKSNVVYVSVRCLCALYTPCVSIMYCVVWCSYCDIRHVLCSVYNASCVCCVLCLVLFELCSMCHVVFLVCV